MTNTRQLGRLRALSLLMVAALAGLGYRLVDLQAAVVDLIGPPAKPSEPPQPTA